MIKIKFIFILIIIVFITSCISIYDDYILNPNNKNDDFYLIVGFWAIQPTLFVSLYLHNDKPISDLNINNLFIQIGDIDINYDFNRISEKNFGIISNIDNIFKYRMWFSYKTDNCIGDRIKNENIDNFKVIFEYNIIVNNEIVNEIIEREYNMRVKKSAMLMWF